MRWILAFHIIFVICWFAGLFYLPRLFVYHAMTEDVISLQRFKIMERKLYFGIMLPSALLTILFGGWLIVAYPSYYLHTLWMHVKLTLVFLLIVYQLYCGKLLFDFKYDRNKHSHVFYRVLNEIPVVFLAIIVILAVVKPF